MHSRQALVYLFKDLIKLIIADYRIVPIDVCEKRCRHLSLVSICYGNPTHYLCAARRRIRRKERERGRKEEEFDAPSNIKFYNLRMYTEGRVIDDYAPLGVLLGSVIAIRTERAHDLRVLGQITLAEYIIHDRLIYWLWRVAVVCCLGCLKLRDELLVVVEVATLASYY